MTFNYSTKDYLNMIETTISKTEVENKDGMLEFINHKIELLNRRSEKAKNTFRTEPMEQTAIRVLKEEIIEVLRKFDEPVSATIVAEKTLCTTPKIAALLRSLVEESRVIKTVNKKKNYYSVNC